jgi:hypothetical protein
MACRQAWEREGVVAMAMVWRRGDDDVKGPESRIADIVELYDMCDAV